MQIRKELLNNTALLESIEEYQTSLSLLCRKFNYAVDTLDIIKWLKNFPNEQWEDALAVLSMVEYLDDSQIIEAYDYCLTKLIEKIPLKIRIPYQKGRKTKWVSKKTRLIVSPIGNPGKSSWAMIYFLKKTKTFEDNKHRFDIITSSDQLNRYQTANFYFVFVDDYFGSGKSVLKHYNEKIAPNLSPESFKYWLTVVSQQKAIEVITSKVPNSEVLYWSLRSKVFTRDKSPFGNRERVIRLRELCYLKGTRLLPDDPLGYENTQGMTTFSYGSPNNMLPIFWSSNRRWHPLFPRYSKDRMERARTFRKETAYWLGLAKTLGDEAYSRIATGHGVRSNNTEYKFVKRLDFRIFSIVRMIKQKRSIPVICQYLGMSQADYDDTINEGFRRNLFDQAGNLTQYGETCYRDIANKVLEYRIKEVEPLLSAPVFYVPKMFREST